MEERELAVDKEEKGTNSWTSLVSNAHCLQLENKIKKNLELSATVFIKILQCHRCCETQSVTVPWGSCGHKTNNINAGSTRRFVGAAFL